MQLFNNIKSDVKRYNANFVRGLMSAMTKLGFIALLNYRVGYCLRQNFRRIPIAKQIIWVLTGISRLMINILTGIDIPYSAKIGKGLKICHFGNIFISSGAVIGDMCTIHQGVTIGKGGHNTETREPVIGDDVFIGANATIIGDINIGSRVLIGSGVCCFKTIEDDCTVVTAGIRVIKNENSTIT